MSDGLCYEGCDYAIEWRIDALDGDGNVIRSLFACGDGEDLAQQITAAIVSSGPTAASANVMQWAVAS